MTTTIDSILDKYYSESDSESESESDSENILEIIMDLSRTIDKRLEALEKYYNQVGDNALDVISTLAGMYQISGSKSIEQFFYRICTNGHISPFLKLEAAKNILEYEETEEGSYDQEETKQRNTERRKIGYKALDYVCYDLTNMPTPCRVMAIFKLMESENFQENANSYFKEFVRDNNIECDFRYKTILSLEKIGADLMKEDIDNLFTDKEFVSQFYNSLEMVISKLFPKIKPNINDKKFWNKLIFQLSYQDIHDIYKQKFPQKPCGRDLFIQKSQIAFLFHEPNMTYYRILSGQYLLQKCDITETIRFQVESEILKFAKDKELDYNRRADAADVLIRLGTESMKQHGRDIIMELGRIDGNIHTVFENAQNVHIEEVEESVAEVLEFLSTLPLYKVKNNPIDFEYVNEQIEKILKDQRESITKILRENDYDHGKNEICDHCQRTIQNNVNIQTEINIENNTSNKPNKFCSNECLQIYFRDQKIRIAMNRIFMDRALYSKFNSTLVNILLKIYTYIIAHEEESIRQQMYKRLLEELEDMSGTCSTGFASRLVNVISGFGNFNIRISYEDQIIANFTGRLNAAARHITDKESIFRNERLNDMIELWLNRIENKEIKDNIEFKLNPTKKIEKRPNNIQVIQEFLSDEDNREQNIQKCIEDFSEAVLNEMISDSSNYDKRQNFALFFRSYVSFIREELSDEFKDLVDSTLFDLAFRKAIMHYEIGN